MTIHIIILHFFFLYRQTTPATLLTITETVIIIVVIYCMEQEVAVIMAMEEIMVVTILVSTPHRHHLPELLMLRHPPMEEPQSTCHHPQGTTPPSNQPIICIPQEFHPPITKQHRQQISMLNTRYMFVPPQSVQPIVNLAMEWASRTAIQPIILEALGMEEVWHQERILALITYQHLHPKGLHCSNNALIPSSITKTWWIITQCM